MYYFNSRRQFPFIHICMQIFNAEGSLEARWREYSSLFGLKLFILRAFWRACKLVTFVLVCQQLQCKESVTDAIFTSLISDVVLGYPRTAASFGFLPTSVATSGQGPYCSFVSLRAVVICLFFFFLNLNTIFMLMTFKFLCLSIRFLA